MWNGLWRDLDGAAVRSGGRRGCLLSQRGVASGIRPRPRLGNGIQPLQRERVLTARDQHFHIQHFTVEVLSWGKRRLRQC